MANSPITVQISDAVTLRDNERKLQAQYVTAERQKWRERIRELTTQTVSIASHMFLSPSDVRKLRVICAELKVRLNLYNSDVGCPDQKIINHITNIIDKGFLCSPFSYTSRLQEIKYFENEVSWLLKEDWERVKYETRPLWLWLYPKRKIYTKNDVSQRSDQYEERYFNCKSPPDWMLSILRFFSFIMTVFILALSLAVIIFVIKFFLS